MVTDPNDVAATPEHEAFLDRVRAAAAADPDGSHARELDEIDRIVARRMHTLSSDRLTRDLAAVAAAAHIDLEVPTDSRIAVGRGIKTGVKKLVRWYVDPLGHQVAVFGGAVTSFAGATSAEVDRLENEIASLRADVEMLAARLEVVGDDSVDDAETP